MKRPALDPAIPAAPSYDEAHNALRHAPGLVKIEPGGSHIKYHGPYGIVPLGQHGGNLSRAFWRRLIRQAIAAGLALLVLAWLAAPILAGA